MKRVTWTQSAIQDLHEIQAYYADLSPDLARDMLGRIIRSARWLLDYPGSGSRVGYRRWHRWRAKRTPYLLIYEPTRDGISVARVRHEQSEWRPE